MNGGPCETASYRELAVAVLRAAMADSRRGGRCAEHARVFLAGGGTFRIWREWLGYDADALDVGLRRRWIRRRAVRSDRP